MRSPLLPRHCRLLTGLLVAVLMGALAACGSDTTDATSTTPAETSTTPATPTPPQSDGEPKGDGESNKPAQVEVPESLSFTGTTVAGEDFDAAELAGKPVLVWFWAPWCAVCRSQIPQVQAYAADNPDLAVIGVGSLDSGPSIAGFADDVPDITHLTDESGDIWQRFGITEQSSFVVLDSAGQEVLRTGYNDDDAVAAAIADVTG